MTLHSAHVAKSLLVLSSICLVSLNAIAQSDLSPKEQLGRFLYFDKNLSEPKGQACASCHSPELGFVDPDSDLPVSEGVIPGLFGNRNAPMAAYAMYAPPLQFDPNEGLWIGGQFWDGRATGATLHDPLADQALGPFLNHVEMNNPGKDTVIRDVAKSSYAGLFEQVWGRGSLRNVESAYNKVALSIAAFERTQTFGKFNSKYDAYLKSCLGAGGVMDDCAVGAGPIATKLASKIFNKSELRGMQLFMGENNNDGVLDKDEGALCAGCHVAAWTQKSGNVATPEWAPRGWVPPVFTDFTFDNLGIPKNTGFPFKPDAATDNGLGVTVANADENGKFKVMTLRNIDLTAPYGHNGLFASLKNLVHFYNTRDVPGALPGGRNWPAAEVPGTVNHDELGSLGLSDDDEIALVKFLKTLSDGYMK